jgi:hypothetical protein
MADTLLKVRSGNIKLDDTFDFSSGVVSVATPTQSNHAVTKAYVDGAASEADFKYAPALTVASASATATITGHNRPASASAVLFIFVNQTPVPVVASNNSDTTKLRDVVVVNSSNDLSLTFNASLNADDVILVAGQLVTP